MALLAAVVLGLTVAPSAEADQYYTRYCPGGITPCVPDGYHHTYCFNGNWDAYWDRAFVHDAMQRFDHQTNYTIENKACGGSDIDVVWLPFNDPNTGILGAYQCVSVGASGRCRNAWIQLNAAKLTNYTHRRHSACHELGHSAGVSHDAPDNTDCLMSGLRDNWSYNNHHITHMNSGQ